VKERTGILRMGADAMGFNPDLPLFVYYATPSDVE
jgi:hypothetical protein